MFSRETQDNRSPTFMGAASSMKTSGDKKSVAIPVRMCDMDLTAFGISSGTKPNKKSVAIPVRMCDMNLEDFERSSRKKNPVRKQLWSNEKRPVRSTFNFKPDRNVRKTLYNKPLANPLPNTVRKTLQLVEKSEENKKRKINKTPTFIPTIKIHKPDTTIIDKSTKTKSESNAVINNNNLDELFNKLESKFNEVSNKFQSEMELKISKISNKFEQKLDEIMLRLTDLEVATKNKCTNCHCICASKPDEKKVEVNNSCPVVEDVLISPKPDEISLNTTSEVNNLIDDTLQNINKKENKKKIEEQVVEISNNKENEDIQLISPTKKFVNKFEILESKLKRDSFMSDALSLSDTESPASINTDLNWLINDFKSPLRKFSSTPSLNAKKAVSFQPKLPNNIHANTVNKYNEIRNNVHFLCTPKNTRTVSNLMTPSVENNQKKKLSRKIQEQLFLLE